MSDKPWRPNCLHPDQHFMHDAYGITEQRRVELCELMAQLKGSTTRIITFASRVDELADIAQSPEEFAWCLVTHTMYLEKKNQIL